MGFRLSGSEGYGFSGRVVWGLLALYGLQGLFRV